MARTRSSSPVFDLGPVGEWEWLPHRKTEEIRLPHKEARRLLALVGDDAKALELHDSELRLQRHEAQRMR